MEMNILKIPPEKFKIAKEGGRIVSRLNLVHIPKPDMPYVGTDGVMAACPLGKAGSVVIVKSTDEGDRHVLAVVVNSKISVCEGGWEWIVELHPYVVECATTEMMAFWAAYHLGVPLELLKRRNRMWKVHRNRLLVIAALRSAGRSRATIATTLQRDISTILLADRAWRDEVKTDASFRKDLKTLLNKLDVKAYKI